MKRALLLCACGVLASAHWLSAQCPDGTPPPCRGARPAAVPARPLDDRTWIVLPFSNVARASDLDWLSSASVNLLYNDMSRWTDIRVVDDERVADLLRDVPEAGRAQLGLEGGMAVARRAGARNLVMGDLLHEGPRTSIIAKVFDVRSGTRLRTVRVQTVGTDSISASFSQLARLVLSVPPPSGTSLSGAGTSSVEALRAYTAGMLAYNRWRTDSALIQFRRAVALDSTFALAHLRIGQILGNTGFGPQAATSFRAAERFSESLPERERLLIAASRADAVARCDIASRLLRLDSADVDGWITMGGCRPPGAAVVLGSAGRARFVTSLNTPLRAYQRALGLQPANLVAFASELRLMVIAWRLGCAVDVTGGCPLDRYYLSAIVLDHDTIATTPEPLRDYFRPPHVRRAVYAARRAVLERARDIASAYTAANPRQWYAHGQYAYILLGLGDLAGADRELRAAEEAATLRGDRRTYYRDRIELDLRRERPEAAAALLDSMFLDSTASAQPQFATAFGRFSRDIGVDDTDSTRALRPAFMATFAGVVPQNSEDLVSFFARVYARQSPANLVDVTRQQVLELGTMLAFHSRRAGPALDTASLFPLVRYEAFFARRDTARARAALAEYDAWVDDTAEDFFTGGLLFSAESHLELGDSAVALGRMQRFGREWSGYWLNTSGLFAQFAAFASSIRLVTRTWLLYADLAMANGRRDDALRGYRMVVGLWEGGEPPVQPLVARARAALAQLGN